MRSAQPSFWVGRAGLLSCVAAAVGALMLPAATETGCAGDDCDSDVQTFPTCGGDRLDANTWESGPLDGTYLDFHGERTWIFNPSGWMGSRVPATFNAYLSLNPQPNAEGGDGFAQPAGNLAEITAFPVDGGYQVQVLNDTCAQYYLRVVITYAETIGPPLAAASCAMDAGKE
jgi:hypothetical protein